MRERPRYRTQRTWYVFDLVLLFVLPLLRLTFQAFVVEFSVADQWFAPGEATDGNRTLTLMSLT